MWVFLYIGDIWELLPDFQGLRAGLYAYMIV